MVVQISTPRMAAAPPAQIHIALRRRRCCRPLPLLLSPSVSLSLSLSHARTETDAGSLSEPAMDPAAAGVLTLVVEKGPRKGETVECRLGGRVRIGRVVRGNTFAIKDFGISQAHLSIEAVTGGAADWALTDLGSSNGTLLNGVRIEASVPAALRDGDAIKIGEETSILVRIAGSKASDPPAAAVRRRNPRRGCGVVAEEATLEEAGGAARGRRRTRRTTASDTDGAGDGERPVMEGELSVGKSNNEVAVRKGKGSGRVRGRGRGAHARKATADADILPSISEESEKVGQEALEDGNSKIPKEPKLEVKDFPQILNIKHPEQRIMREREASAKTATTAGAPAEEQARVGDETVASHGEDEEDCAVVMGNPGLEESCIEMENMTLEEWFDRMEKYLPKVINGIADDVISEIKGQAQRFNKYVSNNMDPEQRDKGGGFTVTLGGCYLDGAPAQVTS